MKKFIIPFILLAFLTSALFAAYTTNTVSQDTYGPYSLTNSTAGVRVSIDSATYTGSIYVTCFSGQIYVEPNCVLDSITIDGTSTSRVERSYLTLSNTLVFTQSGFPKVFTIGNTNLENNTYLIKID